MKAILGQSTMPVEERQLEVDASGTDASNAHSNGNDRGADTTVRECLGRIVHSPAFVRATRMQRFITFLVEETLAGRASELKEYTIAVNVFDKPADFEPGTSPVVRVEAGRLRRLLTQYYAETGHDDPIIVRIPKGRYTPTFIPSDDGALRKLPKTESEASDIRSEPVRPKSTWPATDERRTVTVVSCALTDECGTSNGGVEDEFLEIFDRFYEICTTAAKKFGGMVDGGASDRLVIYFGWPHALEDSAGRALTAAVEIMSAARKAISDVPFNVRLGVATSEVAARGVLQDGTVDRPAIVGEAPKLALTLLQAAPANAIVVAESTYKSSNQAFEYISAGGLKGQRTEATKIWRLVGTRPITTRFRLLHADSDRPISGRREEIALLKNRWHTSMKAEGQCVALIGDPGIGKSKLAETFLRRIGNAGIQIRAQCSPHHVNSTLYPVIEVIGACPQLPSISDAPPNNRIKKFLSFFDLEGALDEAILGSLLGYDDIDLLKAYSASQRKDMILTFIGRLLHAQIARRPTILLVEDIHWADPTSVELLLEILRSGAKRPFMVVITSRDDLPASLRQQPNVSSIRLSRLTSADCNDLIDKMAGKALLSPEIRATILERADGVPLYVEELTKLFLATERHDGTAYAVPQSLNELLISQLDRLGSTKGIAQLAAVIGRQFTRHALAAASKATDSDIDNALDRLVTEGIVVKESVANGEGVFAFRHALLRDAAYESLLHHSRRQLHHRVACVFIASDREIASNHPELIARHLTDAGRPDEAISYWVHAGNRATDRYALDEATTDFTLALNSIKALPDTIENQTRELDVLISLGFVIRHAKGYGDTQLASIYERARALAAELGDTQQLANATYGLWTHAAGCGRWKAATALAEAFRELSRTAGNESQLAVEASRLLGASAAFRGDFRSARRHLEAAQSVYSIDQHRPTFGFDPGAVSAAYLSWTNWHLGLRREARVSALQALEIAEAKRHASTLAMVLSWLMFYSVCEDDIFAIERYNERLQAVCSERDCRYWQPFGAACGEWAAFQRDGNAKHLDRLLKFTREFRERYLTSCLLLMGAGMCLRLERLEQGLEIAAQARAFIEEHDERLWEAECYRLTGELVRRQGDTSVNKARQFIAAAVECARRQGAVMLERRAISSMAGWDS